MIYLGGGGSAQDEATVFNAAFQPSTVQKITIWPWAQPPSRWAGIISWIQESTSHLGSFEVTIPSEPHFGFHADIIVIPGGNTFQLLHHLQQHDLLPRLREYIAHGGRVYGGSAGAVIQGADIEVIDEKKGGMDGNEIGLGDMKALDLLNGWVVYPHYGDEWKEHCERWSLDKGVSVLGIAERGGMEVDGGRAVNLGPEDVWVFEVGKSVRWGVGEERVL